MTRMECEFQESLSPGRTLFHAVAEARKRLQSIEEKHERLVREESQEICSVGLKYSRAVHEYSNAVMAWLAWLDTRERSSRRRPNHQEE